MHLRSSNAIIWMFSDINILHTILCIIFLTILCIYCLRYHGAISKQRQIRSTKIEIFASSQKCAIGCTSYLPTESICKHHGATIIDFPSDVYAYDEGHLKWYDNYHSIAEYCGRKIVGPMAHAVLKQPQFTDRRSIRIAICGDSTTAYGVDEEAHITNVNYAMSMRDTGIRYYEKSNQLPENALDCTFFSVQGTSFHTEYQGGFSAQAVEIFKCHKEQPFDAVLIIGGWNNDMVHEFFRNPSDLEWHSHQQFTIMNPNPEPSDAFYDAHKNFFALFDKC